MPRTDPRGGPRTRERISQAATRLFVDRGFDAVTVADVAREAGVSSVTVYNHFPRKEDLLLDRTPDAVELLRAALRDRPAETDALAALRATALRLADERLPLSGLADGSVPFLRTVAASPALVARTREIAAELQRVLAEELRHGDADRAGHDGHGDADRGGGGRTDPTLLAACCIAGYTTVLVQTARRLIAGDASDAAADNHRERVEALFDTLRNGFGPHVA